MPSERIELIVPEEYNLERIDKFLTNALETDISRTYIQKLIKENNITVNSKEIKQNYKVKTDEHIEIKIPEPEQLILIPRDIPVAIIYEDDSIAVINKQPGLVVHPGPGNWDNTLVNALLFHLKSLSSIGGVARPGIVHRLDKDTSGLMVIAKNDVAHKALSNDFASRKVIKKYFAIINERPDEPTGIIDRPIGRHPKYRHKMTIAEGGRNAVTEYHLKKIWNDKNSIFSALELTLHTGRTHQIRVHLSSIGHPIIGDQIYSKKWAKYKVPYLMLAAVSLEFTHPESEKKMHFDVPLPEHIQNFIHRLENSRSSQMIDL
ncbi:MAG: RluA family pseudouridine synthase [Spirochaetes bacterium]|nr:RluA family pseudouridine synthase [Spirochaetota bacterium]